MKHLAIVLVALLPVALLVLLFGPRMAVVGLLVGLPLAWLYSRRPGSDRDRVA